MILIKHLMDPTDPEDGQRLWIEPVNLTLDLRQWCKVDRILNNLAPKRGLWDWFGRHPDGYEYFRGMYHQSLDRGRTKNLALDLARTALQENITLLHQSNDPEHNSATALYEYLAELQAYCPPET